MLLTESVFKSVYMNALLHTHTHLQFLQSETPSCPYFSVVFERGAPDDRSELPSHGTGGHSRCLLQTLLSSSLLLSWLVEPRPHIAFPVLFEVSIGQHSIGSGRHLESPEEKNLIRMHVVGDGRINRIITTIRAHKCSVSMPATVDLVQNIVTTALPLLHAMLSTVTTCI